MELNEKRLEDVLGGANPAVMDENMQKNGDLFRQTGDKELESGQLEKVLGGANPAVIDEKVMDNKDAYRPRSVEEIVRERQELEEKRSQYSSTTKAL